MRSPSSRVTSYSNHIRCALQSLRNSEGRSQTPLLHFSAGTLDIQVPVRRRRPVVNCAWVLASLLLFVGNAAQAIDKGSILLQAPWAGQLGWATASDPPCVWQGIRCDADGTVLSV